MTRGASALAIMLTVPGCVDPDGTFEAFNARCDESPTCRYEPDPGMVPTLPDAGASDDAAAGDAGDPSDAGGCSPPAPGELSGDYLFVLGALVPERPVLFRAAVTTTAAEAGGTNLNMVLHPIDSRDRQTEVCEPIPLPPLLIDAQGRMDAQLPVVRVPGYANAISGRAIEATPILKANFCGVQDSYCGAVEGLLTRPLQHDLTGSTFAMLRMTAGEAAPDPLVVGCGGKLAEGIPPPQLVYDACE